MPSSPPYLIATSLNASQSCYVEHPVIIQPNSTPSIPHTNTSSHHSSSIHLFPITIHFNHKPSPCPLEETKKEATLFLTRKMAACGMKLQHMFEKTLLDNPTLIESLSWNQHINSNHARQSSFTEIFGELYFKEVSHSPPPSARSIDANAKEHNVLEKNESKSIEDSRKVLVPFSTKCYTGGKHKISDSFSSMSSESLHLCTEGLGLESSDTSDDLETQDYWQQGMNRAVVKHSGIISPASGEIRRPRVRRGPFPPPISCIGKSGKPWVYFKSYKQDGRFVLKEIMIPTQECLHASREDGRLKLHFVHKDDDFDYPAVYKNDLDKEDKCE